MRFNYNLPVNLIFGSNRVEEAGTEVLKYGKKALIVTGKNSTKKTGLLDRVAQLIRAAGGETVIFDEVEPNPLTTTAYRGAELAGKEGCDVVVGLGGGSIMDAAKAIAFLVLNEGDISDYIFGIKQSSQALPIVLIPTTCGTGSEGNGFAVLTNPENKDKKSLRCNAIIAKASIIDPLLMTTMPKGVLASVGFDALCHNMEGYLSNAGQSLTDQMALEGIGLTGRYLVDLYEDNFSVKEDEEEAWEAITWASTLGGMVINTAGVTAPHGMEHPASGLKDIVHGGGLAALTPVIYEESIQGAPEKFAVISRLLGGTDETDCVDRIKNILKKLHLETTLGKQGIKEEDIEWMAENCLKVSAVSMKLHPVLFELEDIKRIYKKAL